MTTPRIRGGMALLAAAAAAVLTAQSPAIDRLRHPASLPHQPAATTEELRQHFADPPAEFRSMPLWVWNDELDAARLTEQLAQFRKQGMGGVFVHPRPGLMTEYLGADWFRLWKVSAEEGRRLGLFVNIYDENSYPAGFAGGLVPSRAPDTAAQFVQAEENVPAGRIPWNAAETVAVFAARDGRRIARADQFPAGSTAIVFRLRRASGNPWTAGFPYVDLTNPQTAPNFLQTTFEAYRRQLGAEFGKTVRWVFDDEPNIATGGAYDSAALALPLSQHTLSEFRQRCGYDLADKLPSLYWDVGDYRQVRFDYWQTLHDLWKENYFRPLYEWCDRHGLQFTGHWMEHTWPEPWISPDDASLYAYEHVPGIDMLEGANIRTHGADPHMLFTIKQVASVSHQLGRRAFCEAYGVSGWDSTLEHYKRFGDWLVVHGINFMDQHLAYATVRGARKRDHPQSFTDVSPWWPYYRLHGDHLGRISYLMSQGQPRNRVVLLEPTTSGFLAARRAGDVPEFARMRQDNGELIQFLADHQVDFDLADEYMLEWFGGAGGKRLRIGQADYGLVVWPRHMINARHQTVPRLEQYLAAGGEVLALGPAAAFVDGRPSTQVTALRERYGAQWHEVADLPALLAEVQKRLEPRVRFDRELPPGIGFNERFLANGDGLLFFANTGLSAVRARATVPGGAVEQWDTVSGRITPYGAASGFDVDLPPAGSQMFLVKKSGAAPPPHPAGKPWQPVEANGWRITADSPNVLVLDYCDLALGGRLEADINTWQANWELWQAHGFERPAWDNAVQFRTRIFDRNHFPADSGFDATFRFTVSDAAALRGLELAAETPERYRIQVNGDAVPFAGSARWLDPHIRSVNIEKWARTGQNTIRVSGRPFDVRMELENIYLRGRFAAAPAGKGFRLAAARKLEFGSWAQQGYPFYGDSVTYQAEVAAPAGAGALRVELNGFQGSVAEVRLDGRRVAVLGWQPFAAEFAAAAGKHLIDVCVISTPRNVFGPFHNRTRPRMRAWPAAWSDFPEHQPAGAEYDVLDYGLASPPTIRIR